MFNGNAIPEANTDIGAFELQTLDGDFNDDGLDDLADIDALVAVIASPANLLEFDLTGDDLVSLA